MAQEVFYFDCNGLIEAWQEAKKILKSYQRGKIDSVASSDGKKYRIVIDVPWTSGLYD